MQEFNSVHSMNILYPFIIIAGVHQNWLCFKLFQNILNFLGQRAGRYETFCGINGVTSFLNKHL